MTVSNEDCRTAVTGNAAIGQVVPFTFPISVSSDLEVILWVWAAGAEFGIKLITGAAANVTATMDVFGYIF